MGVIHNENKSLENKEIIFNNNINSRKIVKSSFVLKKVFYILDENIKLNMIKYNKNYQNLFGISIGDYKEKSGVHIIGDRNGKGIEYDSENIKIFEGEYLNGKGKEYYKSGKLKFKGEYFKGYPKNGKGYTNKGKIFFILEDNGKGKEYYNNGKIRLEGEYLNGKKYNGKGYNYNGDLEYELKYGCGKVKEYYYNGYDLKFKGTYLNGKKWNGLKLENDDNDKLIFKGEYLNGKRNNGNEYYENGHLKYEGQYINGKRNAKGIEYYNDFSGKFEGE